MRYLHLAAAAVCCLSSAAYAGEGNGEPFPGPDNALNTVVGDGVTARMQDPFHYAAPTTVYRYGASPAYATRMQDPYQFRRPDQVIMGQGPSTVARAPASNASPPSTAQGLAAPEGTHG